jgi:hypothetical protein
MASFTDLPSELRRNIWQQRERVARRAHFQRMCSRLHEVFANRTILALSNDPSAACHVPSSGNSGFVIMVTSLLNPAGACASFTAWGRNCFRMSACPGQQSELITLRWDQAQKLILCWDVPPPDGRLTYFFKAKVLG